MVQIIEQTREEKMAMYMKLPKRQIAEMLLKCNDKITAITQAKDCVIPVVSGSLPFSESEICAEIKRGIKRLKGMGIKMGWKIGTPQYCYGFRDALEWVGGNDG